MPTYEQNLHIYNLGEKGANIKLEIISVKLFGEEILDSLKEKLEITNKDNKIIILMIYQILQNTHLKLKLSMTNYLFMINMNIFHMMKMGIL